MTKTLVLTDDEARALETLLSAARIDRPADRGRAAPSLVDSHYDHISRVRRAIYDRLTAPVRHESPAERDYRLARLALEAEALTTGKRLDNVHLGVTPIEARAVDLHRAALALSPERSKP